MAGKFQVGFSLESTINKPIDTRVTGLATELPDDSVCYPGLLRYHRNDDTFVYYDRDFTWKPLQQPAAEVTVMPGDIGVTLTADTADISDVNADGGVPNSVPTTVFTLQNVPSGAYIVQVRLFAAKTSPSDQALSSLLIATVKRGETVIGKTFQEGITPQAETSFVYHADAQDNYTVEAYFALPTSHRQLVLSESSFTMTRLLVGSDVSAVVLSEATMPVLNVRDVGKALTVAASTVSAVSATSALSYALQYPSTKLVNEPGLLRHIVGGNAFSINAWQQSAYDYTGTAQPRKLPMVKTIIDHDPNAHGRLHTAMWSGYFRNRDDEGNALFQKLQMQLLGHDMILQVNGTILASTQVGNNPTADVLLDWLDTMVPITGFWFSTGEEGPLPFLPELFKWRAQYKTEYGGQWLFADVNPDGPYRLNLLTFSGNELEDNFTGVGTYVSATRRKTPYTGPFWCLNTGPVQH